MKENIPIHTINPPHGGYLYGHIFVTHPGGGTPEYSVEIFYWLKPGPRSRPRKEHTIPARDLQEQVNVLNRAYTWVEENPLKIASTNANH
jgi:hypothetical protein